MTNNEIDSNKEILFINPFETLDVQRKNISFLDKTLPIYPYGDRMVTNNYRNLKQK